MAVEGGQVVVDEAAAPQLDAMGRETWLKELERRRARGATEKTGSPLQEILDDVRSERP